MIKHLDRSLFKSYLVVKNRRKCSISTVYNCMGIKMFFLIKYEQEPFLYFIYFRHHSPSQKYLMIWIWVHFMAFFTVVFQTNNHNCICLFICCLKAFFSSSFFIDVKKTKTFFPRSRSVILSPLSAVIPCHSVWTWTHREGVRCFPPVSVQTHFVSTCGRWRRSLRWFF